MDIRYGDVKIKQHPHVKYLGCILDSNFSGESMALHALTKQSFLSTYLRRLLCNAIIQPHFDFACLAWYPCLNNNFKKKIQVAQNKCIRFCLNLSNIFHIGTKQFEAINWLPTKERFEQSACVAIINFFAGAVPVYVSEMLLPIQQESYYTQITK